MAMPGSYGQDIEVELAVSDEERYSPSAEDIEYAIGVGAAGVSTSDDDDEYNDDDEEDDETVDDDYVDGILDGDYDDTSDDGLTEAEDYIDADLLEGAELAEAERMAAAAEAREDGQGAQDAIADEEVQEQSGYTLAIDPTTNRVYIVDSRGRHQNLELGNDTNEGGMSSDTLSILGRLLGRRSLRSGPTARRGVQSTGLDQDEDEDDEDDGMGMFHYGFRGGRRTAKGLFPRQTSPIDAGVELERRGLFGKPSQRYDTERNKRMHPYGRNINEILKRREYHTGFSSIRRCNVGDSSVPNSPGTEVAKGDANIYCGQYSQDGSFFYTCAQDFKIRIYDMLSPSVDKSVTDPQDRHTGRRFRQYRMSYDDEQSSISLTKTIRAREHLSSWTITDANLSPDNTKMIWSTIGPVVGMTRVKESPDDMETYDDGDGQVALDFGAGRSGGRRHFGIWSVRFSADGREIVAGAGSGSIYVYDLERRETVLNIFAHEDDVNAVCFADTASSNVLVSGSDDNYLKVWDRRSLGDSGRRTRPSGVLVGHTEGITYVDPKGDGRFVLSNGKDQTCKLWDLRMMYSDDEFSKLDRLDVSVRNFDYRHGLYKKPRFAKHPHDRSVMTYTGHTVLRTLIRCHFSPAATTGQHYVYSGSYDGRIHVWNLDGRVKQVLDRTHTMPLLTRGASSNTIKMNDPNQPDRPLGTYPTSGAAPVVRDVSWDPFAPVIMSSAWTESGGSLAMHQWKGSGKRQEE